MIQKQIQYDFQLHIAGLNFSPQPFPMELIGTASAFSSSRPSNTYPILFEPHRHESEIISEKESRVIVHSLLWRLWPLADSQFTMCKQKTD